MTDQALVAYATIGFTGLCAIVYGIHHGEGRYVIGGIVCFLISL
jgi:hypothetical protein